MLMIFVASQIMSFKMRDTRSTTKINDESTSADSTLELELQHAKSRRRRQRHQQKVANDFPVSAEAVKQEMEVSFESLGKKESNPGNPKIEMERKIAESGIRPLAVNNVEVSANPLNNEMVPIEVQALRNVIAKRMQKMTSPPPPGDSTPKQESASRLEISAMSANNGKNESANRLDISAMSANNGKNESANRVEISAMSANNGKNESANRVDFSAMSANDGKNRSVNKLEMTAMSAENVKNDSANPVEKTTMAPPPGDSAKKEGSANKIDIMSIMSPDEPSTTTTTTTVKTPESGSLPSPNIFNRIASVFKPESTTTTTTTTTTAPTTMNSCLLSGGTNVATNMELTKETKVEVVAQPGPVVPPPRPVVQHAVGIGGPVAMRAVAEDDDLHRTVRLNNRAKRLRQMSPHNDHDHENLQIEAFF